MSISPLIIWTCDILRFGRFAARMIFHRIGIFESIVFADFARLSINLPGTHFRFVASFEISSDCGHRVVAFSGGWEASSAAARRCNGMGLDALLHKKSIDIRMTHNHSALAFNFPVFCYHFPQLLIFAFLFQSNARMMQGSEWTERERKCESRGQYTVRCSCSS